VRAVEEFLGYVRANYVLNEPIVGLPSQ
jgi:hypothetical protein